MIRVIENTNIQGGFNVALVISKFNQEITRELYVGAIKRLQELGFSDEQITVAWVPGAIEIPITAQRFALTKKYQAIICMGAVIYGETRHFDYVCDQVSQGCQHVALTHNIPVIFGVLTTDNIEQARERTGGKKGHMGFDAVNAAMEMVSVLGAIDNKL